jgi:hypothetical protein
MEGIDNPFVKADKNPRYGVARKIGSDFPKTISESLAERHADRPPILDPL